MIKLSMPAAAFASALWLAGCSGVELQNKQAAEELARLSKPPGSVYTGWRVFQDKCAGCHGPAATGVAGVAPDLLPLVRQMSSRRFVSLVLTRYDWGFPTAQAGADKAAHDTLVDEVVQGKKGTITMPAWQGEPRVNAQIADLYAYLSARAEGGIGTGRPVP
jgi:mono/diheme cytochrome c family protein